MQIKRREEQTRKRKSMKFETPPHRNEEGTLEERCSSSFHESADKHRNKLPRFENLILLFLFPAAFLPSVTVNSTHQAAPF
ncbi:hypothetical protein CEXT_542801 [Caerostris extrusa]|uniref:Uncharacterized protein n=1 Tax=Caerostris extrusa TaxID=172846 RepID=A0AAV4Q5P7_CAEEX|nr:hypothetical protein CEXT_542801 [Caerostris extrusa]